jgi:CRISPR-associated protein Csb1
MAESGFSFGGMTVPPGTKRLYITADLVSSTGDPRIQPTGFPDIGPVFYQDPSTDPPRLICLIESEASMANRLEEVCLADKHTGTLLPELAGLPYIKVMKGDRFMTASTLDGHRFASQYILEATFREDSGSVNQAITLVDLLKRELGVDPDDASGKHVPAAHVPRIFRLAMEFDPLSLVHGFQISSDKLKFVGLRLPRALTASIVGLNAEPVGIPGIKFNPLATGNEAEGVQPIFRKERIVAKTIRANFAIDVSLLAGLAVGREPVANENAEQTKSRNSQTDNRRAVLLAISLWKVARFLKDLSDGHRLRTECDLVLQSATYKTRWRDAAPADFPYDQIVADGEAMGQGDRPAEGSLRQLILNAGLPENRSPLTLEFGG